MPLVSVIVPIFGAEKTLLRCLDSLKSQTFEDFEVLMIDDGSPDRCGEIIDDYAKSDNRFKAFHKENGGVSSARQYGIEHAQGEYTIHADPDDWVEPNMLECLLSKAIDDNSDMVICDYYINDDIYVKQQPSSLDNNIILKELFLQIHGSCCNKLIRKSYYKNYHIEFPLELSFCEDEYVIASLLRHNVKVSYVPKAFYHYIQNFNGESLSRKYDNNSYKKDLHIIELFSLLLQGSEALETMKKSKESSLVYRAFYFGDKIYSNHEFKTFFSKYKKNIFSWDYSFIEKIMFYFSCIGSYHFSKKTIDLMLLLKRKIK